MYTVSISHLESLIMSTQIYYGSLRVHEGLYICFNRTTYFWLPISGGLGSLLLPLYLADLSTFIWRFLLYS